MIGLGTIINSALVILGGILGMLFGSALKPRFRDIMTCACGLSTVFIGAGGTFAKMLRIEEGTLSAQGSVLIVLSLVLGGLIGEVLDIENRTEQFGAWLKVKSHSERDPRFIEGFVSASLTICIGAMAIIGPINDALYHDYSLLITKGILDLIIVMAMAASLGKGVVFSVIPLFLFQGSVTLLAGILGPRLSDTGLSGLSLVGNILIFCVGLNLLFGKKIRVANLLPSLIFAVALSPYLLHI